MKAVPHDWIEKHKIVVPIAQIETDDEVVYREVVFVDKGMPIIKAVEVVRCKDCKYYSGIAYKTCIKIPYFWSEDGEGYCSLAERRTDA